MAAQGKFFAVFLRICAHVLFLRRVFVFASARVKGHRINPPLVSSCLMGLGHVNETGVSSIQHMSSGFAERWYMRSLPYRGHWKSQFISQRQKFWSPKRYCRCGPTKLKADGKSPLIQVFERCNLYFWQLTHSLTHTESTRLLWTARLPF